MSSRPPRGAILALLLLTTALLIPGLFAPVLSIRGVLTSEGVAEVAPLMLERGLNDETLATLTQMLNPTLVAMLQFTGGSLRSVLMERLAPSLTAALQQQAGDVEVYHQTRSILGSVRHLYAVGSPVPATLILLFSVIVPLAKAATVVWAVFVADAARRRRMAAFVVSIAKWSMADVFAVALFIAYLAAAASQTPPGDPSAAPLIAFTATFGAGFYWFASYCVLSLAAQQYTARAIARA